MPSVSVIMPCFNHAKFLAESVAGILQQSHADLELIIVDDCSSDNSWEVIRGLAATDTRIKAICHERNLGASKSRNDGLRAATGEFVGFCDADDIWEPDKLRIQIGLLQDHPEFDVVYCDAAIIDEKGLATGHRFSERFPPPEPSSGWLFQELLGRNFVNMQSVLVRRSSVQSAGFFDERIKWVEDWWYWVRLSRHHRFLYAAQPLARYRVHSNSTNLVQKRGYRQNRVKVFNRILHEYLDISRSARADILYQMGVELCRLGKNRAGRRRFREALGLATGDIRAFKTLWRAAARMIVKPRMLAWS